MSAILFTEGGGDTRDLQGPCREAFRALIEAITPDRRAFRVEACGSRNEAFKRFGLGLKTARPGDWVALLVDSEEPVSDLDQPWEHLRAHDRWVRPPGTDSDQALLVVTCTETWIAADRQALRTHFGAKLQVSALPSLTGLEARDRHTVQADLAHATRDCKAQLSKQACFAVLAKVSPTTLAQHLPAFERFVRILDEHLPPAP